MKPRLQIAVLLAATTGFLLIGSYAGYQEVMAWHRSRLIKQAQRYLDGAEPAKSLACLEHALRHDPQNVKACRLMAQLAEECGSPTALAWRSRVIELAPYSLTDRLALARSALMHGYPTLAAGALEQADPRGKETAGYQRVAGSIAIALNEPTRAEAHFSEALRIEPESDVARFNLAMIRLRGTNISGWKEAGMALRNISTNATDPALRCLALRALAIESLRHQETNAALEVTARLLGETNAVFGDQLLRLQALRLARNAEFDLALAACQREASNDPGKIGEFGTWQMERISPAEALNWLRSLPVSASTNQPAALLTAQCLALRQNWSGLHDWLEQGSWGEWEFLRHAFNTLALRSQGSIEDASTEWEVALETASGRKAHLLMLFRLAAQWNWPSKEESVLWSLIDLYPDDKWAFRQLSGALFDSGRSQSLLTLYREEWKRSPSDLAVENNLALMALLLDARELKPHDLACEVYERGRTNARYASTYAFSLHLQNRNAEGLKVMEQLDPKALQDPAIAGYYGLLLQAAGRNAKARTCLDLASRARLLPEERKLFERAKTKTGTGN